MAGVSSRRTKSSEGSIPTREPSNLRDRPLTFGSSLPSWIAFSTKPGCGVQLWTHLSSLVRKNPWGTRGSVTHMR